MNKIDTIIILIKKILTKDKIGKLNIFSTLRYKLFSLNLSSAFRISTEKYILVEPEIISSYILNAEVFLSHILNA